MLRSTAYRSGVSGLETSLTGRLGIEAVDLEEILLEPVDWKLSQLLAFAVLEADRPLPLDVIAERLESLGVEGRKTDLPTSLLKAWGGRLPVVREADGRFAVEVAPSFELSRLLGSLGDQEAASRWMPKIDRELRPTLEAEERGPPPLVVRPLFDPCAGLLAVAGISAIEDATPWVYFGDDFQRGARAHLEAAPWLVGVELTRLLEALDLAPGTRQLVELKPPQKTKRLRRGKVMKLDLPLLIRGSTGVAKPLEDPNRLLDLHRRGLAGRLRRRLEADARGLLAGFQFAVLHDGYRLRWGFLDEMLPAYGLGGDDALSAYDLFRAARDRGCPVDVVLGSIPSRADPWGRAQNGYVLDLGYGHVELERVDGSRLSVPRFDVQAARLVDADGRELGRAGAIQPASPKRDQERPPPPPGEPKSSFAGSAGDEGSLAAQTASSSVPELDLVLDPAGRLHPSRGPAGLAPEAKTLVDAFLAGEAAGLWTLLKTPDLAATAPGLGFGFQVVEDLVEALLQLPEEGTGPEQVRIARPHPEAIDLRLESAPPFLGAERLDGGVLDGIWRRLASFLADRIERHGLAAVLAEAGPERHPRGRVWLHLAENPDDEERPFAFLATFTPLGAEERHIPLAQAFARFGEDRAGLTQLLAPVERAARASPFVAELFRSRALFEPLAWSPEEAYAFLGSAGDLDGTGLRIRLPKKWKERARRPTAQVRIGELSAGLHARSLLSFEVGLTLDGEPFSAEEMAGLLEGVPRLQLLRGQWVEVDPVALAATLQAWQERSADQVNVPEGLRLLSGLDADPRHPVDVVAGEGLRDVLARLRAPGALEPSPSLEAELRPYQREGLAWLSVISELGLGGCLADDMGLGKTLQVIALLLRRKEQGVAVPALVVVPASLIGNWRAELARFAPSLKVGVAHRSEGAAALDELQQDLSSHDVVISTYGTLGRLPTLVKASWSLVVLDEAQAIKNPTTATARTARSLRAPARLALTGTPIENRLGDLWSLFEFLNPGFLGPEATFLRRMKALAPPQGPGFAPLRRLVRPYLLRRLKSDRRIIKDLPDKTELTTRCPLSRRQAALYADSVKALEKALHATEGPKRRGLVLALLTRFKQICNHPSQWLQDGEYRPEDSGKMGVLRDIAETARDRQDKILVFTQFRAMTEPLHAFLTEVFGAPGLILHGGTPTRKRASLVERFQSDSGPPFFVLSLKAAGTGLNLTAASHVVHFDRWWNPAVENQATDRAYRIGQHRNVLVHRFMCLGTLEERIDALIEAKRGLSEEILSEEATTALTELDDEALLAIVRLDAGRALSGEI